MSEPTPPESARARARHLARRDGVESVFRQALSHAPEHRRAFLDTHCPDADTLADVEALLAAHEKHGVLDSLIDEAGPLLSPQDPTPAPAAPPGVPTVARYHIIERLGGGGMGVVYRARDERLGRNVALKFLSSHLSRDATAKRRFLLEARAAAALEHPNICTVHEIGETDDGQLYIVMGCYEGETLDRRIARGPLPVADAVRIAAEIARGLQKAHERGIVHRDIKPANLMCTADGLVKILDFGIAKFADVALTQTGGAIGTVAYMSPEQAFGEPVDLRSDLWSLGVVLFEMLAGAPPFSGQNARAVFGALATAEPPSLGDYRADVPAGLELLLRRLLAKKVGDRPPSAAALVEALAGVAPEASDPARPDANLRPARDSALARAGERRQLTIVASVIGGADALVERLSPAQSEQVFGRIRAAAAEIATRHGGLVNHADADGLVLLFGVPTAHEDDALRAVRAVLELHGETAALAAELGSNLGALVRLRSGLHAGAAVVQRQRDGDRLYRVTGPPSEIAARLAATAPPDGILASPELIRQVGVAVEATESSPILLPGFDTPVTPHRVRATAETRSRLGSADLPLTPFIGRERERATLAAHLAAAQGGVGRVTVLVGEAGSGKSRLLHELRTVAQRAGTHVIVGRCDAYGATTPFFPFVEAVHDALAVPRGATADERHQAVIVAARAIDATLEDSLALYLALLGIPSDAHPLPVDVRGGLFQAAMLDAIAALLALGARRTPTLLLLEDWHWADEASRAALRQVAEIAPAYPLHVVVTSRPEGAEWGSGEHQSVLHLAPLDGAASEAIICAVLGAARVAPALATWVHERTGGNPFFLEEVCAALRESGAVAVREGEAVEGNDAMSQVPGTVQGVLRTRMDRLDDESRDILRVASVIGRDFTRGILDDVVECRDALGPSLERLKASGLVQQIAVVPEAAYRFKHVLAQEVAYDSLLEHQRTALHAAVGRAIEHRYPAQLDKHVERLAHHYARAALWETAVRYGLQAADRAMGLSQNADVMSTLDRAESLLLHLPATATRRDLHADVLLRKERLCETLGLRTRQLSLVESLIALLAPDGPSDRLSLAYLRQGDAFTLLRRFESAERSMLTARQIAAELGDSAGERNALRSLSFLRSHEGRPDEALTIMEEVLSLARAAGDRRAEHGDLASVANILRALGQSQRALETLMQALDDTDHAVNPGRYGALLNVVASVYRDLGDYPRALEYYRKTASLLSHKVYASFSLPGIAYVQLQQGDVEGGLATYRQAVELNRKARYADGTANASRSLGEVLLGLERYEEALGPLMEAATLFVQLEDRPNEALMRRRVAELHERRGAHAEALAAWELVGGCSRALQDNAGSADALEGMARAERHLSGTTDDVVARYDEALVLALRDGDQRRLLGIHNALGIVHWQRESYPEAVRHYEAALRICRETDDRVHEGLILNSLGATLHRLSRWDEARQALADGARVAEATGERQLCAHALGLLGEVCLGSGRLDEGLRSLEASIDLRRQLGDRRGEGWMLERLARVSAAKGDLASARASAVAAHRIAGEVEDDALRTAIGRLSFSDLAVPSTDP